MLEAVNIDLKGDFVQYWQQAAKIANREELFFLGPSASVETDLRMGPIYYYLLALFYLISFGNYPWSPYLLPFFLFLPLILMMLIYFFLKIKIPSRKFTFLWLAFPLMVFLIYSSNIYLHYFLIYFSLPFIIFSLVIKDLEKRFSWGDRLSKNPFNGCYFCQYLRELSAVNFA